MMPISKPKQLAQKTTPVLPGWLCRLETLAGGVVLCLAALRATILETPLLEPPSSLSCWDNQSISLMLSAVVFLAMAAILTGRAAFGVPCWRHHRLAAAGGILIAALFLPAIWASNRRAALTDATVLASGIVSAIALVETLCAPNCARIALWVVVATGLVASYGCLEKFLDGNQMLIEHYQKDPQAVLNALGIEPNSLEHWQYEHRLYSKGSSGFFTTSNSAGSFLLLVLAVGVGFLLEVIGAPRSQETLSAAIVWMAVILCLFVGLATTYSKGAFGSFLIYFILLTAGLACGDFLWRHRTVVLPISLLGCAMLVAVAVWHGLRYGRLPGGNSMWVRWQYWVASAQMAKDNLFGVGGGNFASAYFAYKDPAAPETINDPHCWFFSILCRFGLPGLAAWLGWMFVWIFWPITALFDNLSTPSAKSNLNNAEGRFWALLFVGMLTAMLGVRPLLLGGIFELGVSEEKIAAYVVLAAVPAAIAAGGMLLLKFADTPRIWENKRPKRLVLSLFCGLVAVLIHNLIDFALFEPGIWSFFHLVASVMFVLFVTGQQQIDISKIEPVCPNRLKAAAIAAGVILFLLAAVLPPIAASHLLYRAVVEDPDRFDEQIACALAIDPLWPRAPHFAASFLRQQAEKRGDMQLLQASAAFAALAKSRDRKNPQCDELLGDIYSKLADKDAAQRRQWLDRSLAAYQAALARYPGSDRLNWLAGQIADQMGKTEMALGYYQKALEIEMAYRNQFSAMYPDKKEVVSRLGVQVVNQLLQRIDELQKQTAK